jgi:hypothetical protein
MGLELELWKDSLPAYLRITEDLNHDCDYLPAVYELQ